MKAETLKKSILQYAMQGKLVEQHLDDEPASELLKRIKAEKEQLIKDGKIKKEKSLSPITDDEIPYELPQSWEWVRLGEIGYTQTGTTPPTNNLNFYGGKYSFVKPADIAPNGTICFNNQTLSEEGIVKGRLIPKGSVLMVCIGGSIGKAGYTDKDCSCNQQINAITPYVSDMSRFIFNVLISPNFYSMVLTIAPQTTMPIISKGKWEQILIPLPPLAEQQQIVEKLEQILPLVGECGKNEEKLSELNKTLPDKIKQSILQHAVQGKLVSQNPTDEPASELLKRIKSEKERLIKDGKIKKEKPLPPITDDEIPFSTPDSWTWCRLGTILEKLTDGAHSTPKYVSSGIPFISVKDISQGFISFDNTKFITKGEHEELCKRCDPKKGDILLTKVGTTGIPVIVDTDVEFSLFVSVAQLRFNHSYINANYIKYLILSPLVQMQCKENTKGVGNKNWVIKDIANTLIVLPPLAEQQRIVDKVEELMEIINKLEVVR